MFNEFGADSWKIPETAKRGGGAQWTSYTLTQGNSLIPLYRGRNGDRRNECLMNASVISALAGATIGGLTSVLASWLTQHTQARAQWLAQDKLRQQELYKEFIEAASKSYCRFQHRNLDAERGGGFPPQLWTLLLANRPKSVGQVGQVNSCETGSANA